MVVSRDVKVLSSEVAAVPSKHFVQVVEMIALDSLFAFHVGPFNLKMEAAAVFTGLGPSYLLDNGIGGEQVLSLIVHRVDAELLTAGPTHLRGLGGEQVVQNHQDRVGAKFHFCISVRLKVFSHPNSHPKKWFSVHIYALPP